MHPVGLGLSNRTVWITDPALLGDIIHHNNIIIISYYGEYSLGWGTLFGEGGPSPKGFDSFWPQILTLGLDSAPNLLGYATLHSRPWPAYFPVVVQVRYITIIPRCIKIETVFRRVFPHISLLGPYSGISRNLLSIKYRAAANATQH